MTFAFSSVFILLYLENSAWSPRYLIAGWSRNSESSGESSESEEEGGSGAATSLVKASATAKGRGGGSSGAKPRKRGVISKVSYKELGSSEASSDDEDLKKTPKKKKRVSSDSEWGVGIIVCLFDGHCTVRINKDNRNYPNFFFHSARF